MCRVAGFNYYRDCIADYWSDLGYEMSSKFQIKAISGYVRLGNLFPAIINRGGFPAFKLKKFNVREGVHVPKVQ